MIVLFGRHRWRRRRAIARLGLGGVDPFGRPNFLYLTDTHRKRRQVALDFQDRNTFEPPARVLVDLLADLWARWGDGRVVLSPQQVAFHAITLLREQPLEALTGGTPEGRHRVAWQLARLLAATLESGTPDSLSPEVLHHLRMLQQRCDSSQSILAQSATRALIPKFSHPEPGLARWMATRPPVIVDDIFQPTPLRSAALLGLLEGIQAQGPTVVFAFESGVGSDTDAIAAALGATEQAPRTHKAFAATHRLRTAVFERFVASGRAEVYLASALGPVAFSLHGSPPEPEPRDLSDWVHAETPIPASMATAEALSITRYASMQDEIRAVVAEVRQVLSIGTAPTDCLIALADPRYRESLSLLAKQLGVGLEFSVGPVLARVPVGRAVLGFCGLETAGPLDWLNLADLLGYRVDSLVEAIGAAGIGGGRPSLWEGTLRAWLVRVGRDPAPLLEQLHQVTQLEALGDRVAADPLAAWQTLPLQSLIERSDRGREAWGTFLNRVAELERSVPDSFEPPDIRLELTRLLWTTHLSARHTGGVAVTGLLELRGLTPAYCWVLGLTRDQFPAPWPASSLLSSRDQQKLAPVDRLAEARYLLASLLRNALGDPNIHRLALSWPARMKGRATTPSVALAEWLQRETSDGQTLGDHVLDSPLPPPLEPIDAPPRVGVGHRGGESTPRTRLSVTAAELALRCPAAFWYRYTLALDPADPWDPELEPRRRGTALHGILQAFYEARHFAPLTPAGRDEAAALLHRVAEQTLDAVEASGGFEPALQAWSRSRWLAGLLDDEPAGLLAAWLKSELDEGVAPASVESSVRVQVGALTLTGTVDRVDHLPGGVTRVTDYKTGRAPARARVEAGLSLQPLVYVEAMARDGSTAVASNFQLMARPDAIRRAGWFGDPEAVSLLGGSRALSATAESRAEQLNEVEARLTEVVNGAVNTTVWGPDLAGCQVCRFRRVCRVEHGSSSC